MTKFGNFRTTLVFFVISLLSSFPLWASLRRAPRAGHGRLHRSFPSIYSAARMSPSVGNKQIRLGKEKSMHARVGTQRRSDRHGCRVHASLGTVRVAEKDNQPTDCRQFRLRNRVLFAHHLAWPCNNSRRLAAKTKSHSAPFFHFPCSTPSFYVCAVPYFGSLPLSWSESAKYSSRDVAVDPDQVAEPLLQTDRVDNRKRHTHTCARLGALI